MDYLVFVIAVLIFVVLVFAEGTMRERKNRRIYREWLKESFGRQGDGDLSSADLEKISLYHKKMAESDGDRFYIDDITWQDLSMDDIFKNMDTCSCILGEESLYHILHRPHLDKDDPQYVHFTGLIRHFTEWVDERLDVQEILHDIGSTRKTSVTTVFDHVNSLEGESNTPHYVIDILMALSIAMIFIVPAVGVVMFVVMMIVSIGSYLKKKKAVDPILVSFNYTARMLKTIEKLSKLDLKILKEDTYELNELRKPLKGILGKEIWLTSGSVSMDNPISIFVEYLKMFFHVDLIMTNRLIRQLKENSENIYRIRTILGTIDASIAAASYRLSLAVSCDPEFAEEKKVVYTIENCIHPLIKDAVSNSIDTDGPILITGSNASGKSTFLKAVAISALMAQTVGYVAASRYRASRFKIYTSMALNDSILNGESYFIVEIKSIKRILDAGDEGRPVLCCIDEVLRGTNTVERIAASTQILKSLATDVYIPFAATHDIELTHILEEVYKNYHFEEEVTVDDVRFNYRMKEGRAQSRNAIRLLQVMDYDQRIIDVADAMVEAFMNKGTWV